MQDLLPDLGDAVLRYLTIKPALHAKAKGTRYGLCIDIAWMCVYI